MSKIRYMTEFCGLEKGVYPHKWISHISAAPGGVGDMVAHLRTGECGWGGKGNRKGQGVFAGG